MTAMADVTLTAWQIVAVAVLLAVALAVAYWTGRSDGVPAGRRPRHQCRHCGAELGAVVGPDGAVAVVDPPRFDADLGWVAPPHVCSAMLAALRARVDADEKEVL